MVKVKGTALKSTMVFLEERVGGDQIREAISNFPDEERRRLADPIILSEWYPFSLLVKLMDSCMPMVKTEGNKSIYWVLGRFSADYSLKGIYKIFFRFADPHYIIKKSSQVFSSYYDSGKMEVVICEPHQAILHLTGFNEPSIKFCDRLLGFMERTLELTGTKSATISHPKCLARGGPYCEYMANWR